MANPMQISLYKQYMQAAFQYGVDDSFSFSADRMILTVQLLKEKLLWLRWVQALSRFREFIIDEVFRCLLKIGQNIKYSLNQFLVLSMSICMLNILEQMTFLSKCRPNSSWTCNQFLYYHYWK